MSMNKQQKNYIMVKALLDTLEAQAEQEEQNYIIQNNIVNSDGTIPKVIYMIEDEDVFNKANKTLSDIHENSGLWDKILKARENLKQAENDLISYGLDIIPVKNKHEKEVLEKECKINYTSRLKVINFILKLDVSTVR